MISGISVSDLVHFMGVIPVPLPSSSLRLYELSPRINLAAAVNRTNSGSSLAWQHCLSNPAAAFCRDEVTADASRRRRGRRERCEQEENVCPICFFFNGKTHFECALSAVLLPLTNLKVILISAALEHEHQINLNIPLGNRLHAGPITSSLHHWWQVSAEESQIWALRYQHKSNIWTLYFWTVCVRVCVLLSGIRTPPPPLNRIIIQKHAGANRAQ